MRHTKYILFQMSLFNTVVCSWQWLRYSNWTEGSELTILQKQHFL